MNIFSLLILVVLAAYIVYQVGSLIKDIRRRKQLQKKSSERENIKKED